MNLVDVIVEKVLVKPHKTKDGLWSTTVITNCWGAREEKTITDVKRWKVERFEKGYTFQA